MDRFPEYYGRLRFNYEAMWAFLHRIGGAGKGEILGKRHEIRRFHRFSVPRFLCYLALQEGIVHTRQALARLLTLSHGAPENILDFVRSYGARDLHHSKT